MAIADGNRVSAEVVNAAFVSKTDAATKVGDLTLSDDLILNGDLSIPAFVNNRVLVSSADKVVEASAITASRALVSDSNGIPTHTSVTTTELSYVSGVTSAIQTQLNTKGTGDASTNTSSSVDSEVALFSSTGGKTLKRASATGVAKLSSGVLSASNVNLASEVTGNLPVTNLNSGTSASATTFWRGDATWATPAGGGGGAGSWTAYSGGLTIIGSTSNPSIGTLGITANIAYYRTNGPNTIDIYYFLYLDGATNDGTPGSGNYEFPLPSGYTINYTLQPTTSISTSRRPKVGDCRLGGGGTPGSPANNTGDVLVFPNDRLVLTNQTNNTFVGSTCNSIDGATTTMYSFRATVIVNE